MNNDEAEPTYYGIEAWRLWRKTASSDLSKARRTPAHLLPTEIERIASYRDLVTVIAFLNVMNNRQFLLFRGQEEDKSLRPTLLRETWPTPKGVVHLASDRAYYWASIHAISKFVTTALKDKLPRHRAFELYDCYPVVRMAPWAVIQHYELWPTPLLDFTSSLRVAASFALDGDHRPGSGYLFVIVQPESTSHLLSVAEDGRAEQGPLAVRLSAVCPPSAARPHLQDGYLVGNPEFKDEDLSKDFDPGVLIAKLLLVDDAVDGIGPSFWSKEFPPISSRELKPAPAYDEVLAAFQRAFELSLENGRAILIRR